MSGPRDAAWARSLDIVPLLPTVTTRSEGPFPPDLYNAKILAVGTSAEATGLEGGGLLIDYLPEGEDQPKRLVLGFNELGMWIEVITRLG